MKGLKAKDVMTRPVVSARKNAPARDIALQMLSGLYSGMPVTDDNGKVVGTVTEFDLLKKIQAGKELNRFTAGDLMSKSPVTVDAELSLKEVAKVMVEHNIIRVPVTNKGRLVGVVARCDILRSFIEPEFVTYM
ncbi:MAG: CBS domain-containing protein [Thermodesulfobacteriota bacterium]|nr:MAG: CBS domain-containing protein [Thermodesulfobacteriota bacterium]